jgi:hypothetical protein
MAHLPYMFGIFGCTVGSGGPVRVHMPALTDRVPSPLGHIVPPYKNTRQRGDFL